DTSIFSLTRVTRIFQKNVFTKTAPAGPAGAVVGFLLRPRERGRCGFQVGIGRKGTTWGFRPEACPVRPAHARQSMVAEMGARRCFPVSGLLFTGNRSTLACPHIECARGSTIAAYGASRTCRQAGGRSAIFGPGLGFAGGPGLGWSTASVNQYATSLPQPSSAGRAGGGLHAALWDGQTSRTWK